MIGMNVKSANRSSASTGETAVASEVEEQRPQHPGRPQQQQEQTHEATLYYYGDRNNNNQNTTTTTTRVEQSSTSSLLLEDDIAETNETDTSSCSSSLDSLISYYDSTNTSSSSSSVSVSSTTTYDSATGSIISTNSVSSTCSTTNDANAAVGAAVGNTTTIAATSSSASTNRTTPLSRRNYYTRTTSRKPAEPPAAEAVATSTSTCTNSTDARTSNSTSTTQSIRSTGGSNTRKDTTTPCRSTSSTSTSTITMPLQPQKKEEEEEEEEEVEEAEQQQQQQQQEKQFSLSMVYSDDSGDNNTTMMYYEQQQLGHEELEEEEVSSNDTGSNFVVYWQRWLMLFYMSMLNLLSDWTCYSVAPISVLTSQTFGNVEPTLLVTVFLGANAVATAVEPMILGRLGLRGTIVLGAFLLLAGSWTKSGIPFVSSDIQHHQGAWKVYFGFFLVGLSQPLYQCTPALLSNSWFPERERTMATGISLNANQLGIGCAFVFGTILVDKSEDIPRYFSLITLLSIFLFLGTLLQFDDAPPTPPSGSARVIRGNLSINLSKHVWDAFQKKMKQPSKPTTTATAVINNNNNTSSNSSNTNHSNVRQRCISSTATTAATTTNALIQPSNAFMSEEPVRNSYSYHPHDEQPHTTSSYNEEEEEEDEEEHTWHDDDDDDDDNYLTPHSPPIPPTYYWGYPTPPHHVHQPINSTNTSTTTASIPYYYASPKYYFYNHNAFATFSDDSLHPQDHLYNYPNDNNINMPLPLPPTLYEFDEGAEPVEIVAPHKIAIDIRDDQIWLSAKACFSRKGFVHSCVAFVVSGIVINTLSTYMDYLVRLGGAGKAYVGIVGGSFQLIIMLSSLLVGRYADETRRYYTVAIGLLVMGAFALAESCVRLDEDDGPQLRLTLLVVAALVGPLQPIATELGVDVAYPLSENTVLVIQQLFSNLLSAAFIQFFDVCKDIGRNDEVEGYHYPRRHRPEYTFSFYLLIVLHACGTVFFATFNGRYLRYEAEEAKKLAKRKRYHNRLDHQPNPEDEGMVAVGERQPLLLPSSSHVVVPNNNLPKINNKAPGGYGTA